MSSLDEAVRRHVDLFNAAVRQSDYRALVDTFAPTAVMRFLGVPAGPFVGRDAIAGAYEESPPDDTLSIVDIREAGPCTAQVRFEWSHGGTGSMTMSWDGGQLIDLTVAFDG